MIPAPADAEVASAIFGEHLTALKASPQALERGWNITRLGLLGAVVDLTARRRTGEIDRYHVRLSGEFYDLWPPSALFVYHEQSERPRWVEAPPGSRWLPTVTPVPSFAIHSPYQFPDGRQGQLVCCSMTLEYYQSNHSPTAQQSWKQGRHTLAATLHRIHDALNSDSYQGPSGALDT